MDIKTLFDLKNTVAIVTGGGSGIGHQLATGLAEAGANLVIASRRYDFCSDVCKKFHDEFGIEAFAIKVDVTKEEDIIRMVEKTIERSGKIDILVNNVGAAIVKDLFHTSLTDWNQIMNVNLTSVFLCCREAGKYMIKQKYGKIINIASILGERATDWRNYFEEIEKIREACQLSYNTSKAGIINLTRDLAVKWAEYNITVNAISPGAFRTDQTKVFPKYCIEKITNRIPMARFGVEDDLKGAIVFLASKASKYLTGHNLIVDGGWMLWC